MVLTPAASLFEDIDVLLAPTEQKHPTNSAFL